MHYPVMTERQLAARWKNSLKTLRRWRSDNEGPTWHKLFQYVRYHEADILGFERQSAQHWSAILGDGERVPKVVTRPPQEQPETEEDAGAFYVTAQDVIEATGLPKHWFTTPEYRARKQVPHLALVGSVRFSLQALWEWEQNHSTVGRPPKLTRLGIGPLFIRTNCGEYACFRRNPTCGKRLSVQSTLTRAQHPPPSASHW